MSKRFWWRQVVAESSDWNASVSRVIGPGTEKVDEEVSSELSGEHLGDDVEVGDESGLEDDWNVGGVEELDWVAAVLSTVAGRLDWEVDTESLEVDNHSENEESSHQVHQVWKVLAVESLTKSTDLVRAGGEKVEESDDGSFELGSTSSVHGGWRECLPDNGFANVGGDEERDSGSETISLLEKLVEKKDDETSDDELDNDEKADSSSDLRWLSVESGHDVDNSLSNGDDHTEQFLGSVEEGAVLWSVSDLDDLSSGEKLHDESRSNDWGDTELHKSTTVGSHNHTKPVEWIGGVS